MTCIDPEDVAAVAVKALTEDGHEGQTYRLTSDDAYTAADLAALLSKTLNRKIEVSNEHTAMAGYFALVASGAYSRTNTAATLLGRSPRGYADWLRQNLPARP